MNTGITKYAELCFSTVINDIDTLERNVRDYPASSLARFLLLYHYKKNGHPGFDKLAAQTGVYLNNPYWIQYQLSQADTFNERGIINREKDVSTITNQPIVTDEDENYSPVTEGEEDTSEANNEVDVSTITNQPIVTDEVENDSAVTEGEKDTSEANNKVDVSTITNQPIVTDEVENDSAVTEGEEDTSKANNKVDISTITNQPIVADEVENDSPVTESEEDTSETNNEVDVSTITNQPIVTDEVENDSPVTEGEKDTSEANNEADVSTITNQPIVTDEVENNSSITQKEEDTYEASSKADVSTVTNQPIVNDEIEFAEKDAPPEEGPIAFEPLHTVDYFASQGIKITREELEKDHFGKQVKSFTAWLKSMKKLHPGQVPEQNDVIEKIIQTSSEISNQNANVLTEAMAEVLIKQNKNGKAIEMYQKLSLINPSKNAYFAAKIENLKHT